VCLAAAGTSHLTSARRLPGSPPRPAPASSPPALSADQPDDQEQQYRADRSTDDRRDNARAEMDSELRKYPARNKRPRDSNDEIANEAQAGALDDLAGKPARDEADNQYDEETF